MTPEQRAERIGWVLLLCEIAWITPHIPLILEVLQISVQQFQHGFQERWQ